LSDRDHDSIHSMTANPKARLPLGCALENKCALAATLNLSG
jgi:hypothetical protein